jgi:hypothetical protein
MTTCDHRWKYIATVWPTVVTHDQCTLCGEIRDVVTERLVDRRVVASERREKIRKGLEQECRYCFKLASTGNPAPAPGAANKPDSEQ